jgi:hypothetical protein
MAMTAAMYIAAADKSEGLPWAMTIIKIRAASPLRSQLLPEMAAK